MSSLIEQEAKETTIALTRDRQWDARFNTANDATDNAIVTAARILFEQPTGGLRYVLVGGPEIGTNPKQDDYGCRHVHLCLVFHDQKTLSAIRKMFGVYRGYYLKPRPRNLPVAGWKQHHVKELSKCDPNVTCLYEAGELPAETLGAWTLRSTEEKKRKVDEILVEIYEGIKKGRTEAELFADYPRNWLMYGEKVKSMVVQRKDFFKQNGDPHIWLHGTAGAGKSALLAYVYPKMYKKCLYNRFFDLYKPTEHTHVILEDLDHNAVETLSLNFIKTLCDESGFTYDQKYKSAQPARTVVLVTSQFDIGNILSHLDKQVEVGEQGAALRRRFYEVKALELHRLLGVKMRTNYELRMLKEQGNNEPQACFMAYNYLEDMPSVHPMPTPEECQQKIRDAYYHC